MQNLSERLKEIAVLVPKSCRVADIGTDHGYLPIYLIKNGIASYVFACDIAEKPLQTAQKNIEASGLHNIEPRLSDGLSNIQPDEIETVVIAGIGGEVISGIIERCGWIKSSAYTLILQPTTSPEKLRSHLAENGFSVDTEVAVCENGKIYSIMKVKYCGKAQNLTPTELFIGRLKPDNECSTAYIEKQLKRVSKLSNDLKNIPAKREEYIYYSQITDTLTKILGGNNGA